MFTAMFILSTPFCSGLTEQSDTGGCAFLINSGMAQHHTDTTGGPRWLTWMGIFPELLIGAEYPVVEWFPAEHPLPVAVRSLRFQVPDRMPMRFSQKLSGPLPVPVVDSAPLQWRNRLSKLPPGGESESEGDRFPYRC